MSHSLNGGGFYKKISQAATAGNGSVKTTAVH